MLYEYLSKMSQNSGILREDIASIVHGKENDTSISKKSLEPITILRKDKAELEKADANDKDVQFVIDKTNSIFTGEI